MEKVMLFYLESPDIKISMEVYFTEKEQLFFDGYDSGEFVEKTWGDYDYEYTYTIEPDQVNRLYEVFGLREGDKSGLLQEMKKRFNVNEAYTLFGNFMKTHRIEFKQFTWA